MIKIKLMSIVVYIILESSTTRSVVKPHSVLQVSSSRVYVETSCLYVS